MPLLGKKVFALNVQQSPNEKDDAPYFIPHTKERFQSKSEYEKRKELYSQNIWTCRATGHTCLTHEEAFKSEQVVSEQLKAQFPKCFEKEVLAFVHHNTVGLDVLVDKIWWKLHQQFVVGEKVNLKVKVADKLLPAKVVAIDTNSGDLKGSTNCNSPSSDKENSSDDKDKEKSPKKWVPPKFLPYTYSIELEKESKIIHSVPAADLIREEKAPSKDLLRLFIRVSAIRAGTCATSPWVVNADLVKEYRLVSKFADFFLSPAKMPDVSKKSEENGKKRKLSNGTAGSSCKKLKLDNPGEKPKKKTPKSKTKGEKDKTSTQKKKKKSLDKNSKSASPGKKSASTPSKKVNGSLKKKASDAIVVSDSDSDEVSLAKLKKSGSVSAIEVDSDSDSDVPLYQLAEQTTPKKKQKKQKEGSNSSDEDVPLSKINTSGATKKKATTPQKKNGITKAQKNNEKTPTKKGDKPPKKAKNKDSKDSNKKASGKKKDGMKQVTLYDLTKKGKMLHKSTTPKKSPNKNKTSPQRPPPTPAIVRRMMVAKRETLNDKVKYTNMLKKAAVLLTPAQLKNVPDKIREEIERKKRSIEEKKLMEKMTPEEKEEFLKEKRNKAKEAQKQKMLQKMRDLRKRFEDTDLPLTTLPVPKLVPTPDGFPNELFGDVAMVTEFINCYGGLLMPDSEYPIYTDALMKALVGGSSGFTYLSRVLVMLLQTLLQDEITKGYKELKVTLSDIAVSAHTASELARLCLEEEDEDADEDDREVPEAHLLRESEFYQLDLDKKLCVLKGLCDRVLATYSVQDYMEEQQRKALALTKQKNSEQRQMAAEKKSKQKTGSDKNITDGDKKSEEKDTKETNENKDGTTDGSMSILSFYGKEAEDSGEEGNNWGSIVKRRRVLAAKAAAEKERQERERAVMREKELQAEKEREKIRKKQEQIIEAILLARMVLRQEPIGTDRHHNRYWVFTNTTPGLYVEKGWMGEEVKYNVPQPKTEKEEGEESMDEDSSSGEEEEEGMKTPTKKQPIVNQTGQTPLKVVYKTKKHYIETTAPHPGQNLWFTYRSQKDLDALLKALHPQGIRESMLKSEIKKRYDDISKAIVQAQRTNLELRDSDGDVEMVETFKKELTDMELRLRNGGLGGVPNFDKWDKKLTDAKDIPAMGDCLLEVKDAIMEKFLQGFMKPMVKTEDKKEELDSEVEEEGNDEGEATDKAPEKEDKQEKALREWKEAVEQCQTMSRLHVLLAMLDTCVKWEKSAENAKCKICRKKCDDDRLLLCDECNQAFHMYCLRPALSKLPTGDWFCPACKPRRTQVTATLSDSEEDEKEEACRECGGTDKLVICSKCPAAYHTQCHEPPLRHPPRGVWECSDCKSGNRGRKKGKLSRTAARRKNYQHESEDSEEEGSEEESEKESGEEEYEDDYVEQTTRSGRVSRSRQPSAPKQRGASKTPQSSGRATSRSKNASQKESPSTSSTTPTFRNSRRGPSELSLCEEVLAKVMRHKSSWPFLEPVDKKLVPDYHLHIKKPMDFQTMQKKCLRLSYASPQEFIEDAALVFENAESYNKPDSDVFECMLEVEKVFRESLGKVLPDWPYYRTVTHRLEEQQASETGRRRSRNK